MLEKLTQQIFFLKFRKLEHEIGCNLRFRNIPEGGCTTHSDVGNSYNFLKLYFASIGMAALFNHSNPHLYLRSKALKPSWAKISYETIKLRGYIAIFDIGENIKVVLYGNGIIISKKDGDIDTFEILRESLLGAIKSCDIATT